MSALYEENTPAAFWRFLGDPQPSPADWSSAIQTAALQLPEAVRHAGDDIDKLLFLTLGEGQFGAQHWGFSSALRLYYAVKPLLPRWSTDCSRNCAFADSKSASMASSMTGSSSPRTRSFCAARDPSIATSKRCGQPAFAHHSRTGTRSGCRHWTSTTTFRSSTRTHTSPRRAER